MKRKQRGAAARPQRDRQAPTPAPPRVIDALLLTGMAPTGEAIGRHEGLVVFVPYGLPGETVQVRLVEQKQRFARGEIVAREEDAPARVAPACPYFGVCGGCDWQHAAYAAQLQFKTAIVAEQLARIGKFVDPPVRPCIGSPSTYEYRNHVRLLVGQNGEVGYRAARSHTLVPVRDCPIAEGTLRRQIADLQTADELRRFGALQPGSEVELRTWHAEILVGAHSYRAGEGAFFQANTAIAARLVDAVLDAVAPDGSEHVLDLYCGVGLFTVPLGRRVAQIVGVEANPVAAADARHNLAHARVAGHIVENDVAAALGGPEISGASWDAVLLDPPRTGLDSAAVAGLIALQPPRIFYVSCEPATLARDLRLLAEAGYQLAWAQPFDMFPQTRHVETLAVCSLLP